MHCGGSWRASLWPGKGVRVEVVGCVPLGK